MAKSNILHTIENEMDNFSKGQRAIANFILDNYDKAAFMSATKLGLLVHVSESTVVRFAMQLGYDGYTSMQRDLQELIRGRLTSLQRMQSNGIELEGADLMVGVLQRDLVRLRHVVEHADGEAFERAVETVVNARRIYIVGFRSSSFLAGYLNFYYRLIFNNVTLVQGGAAGTFDQMFRVREGDVVIVISFPRYSELAIKALEFAHDRGAQIVGITDSEISPICEMADTALLVRNEMISFIDSLSAPMSMVNALILATAQRKGADVSAAFEEMEEVWERFGIFGKVEDV